MGGYALQPRKVMPGALIRLLGHNEEVLNTYLWVLELDRKLLHSPEQGGLIKLED